MQQKPQQRQFRIDIPQGLDSTYANTVMISHTSAEVVFDFIHIVPNVTRATVQQRIVMSPTHAKLFMKAINENIRRYEEKHGEIKLPPKPESLADQLFRNVRSTDGDDNDEQSE